MAAARVAGTTHVLFVPASLAAAARKGADDFKSKEVFGGSAAEVSKIDIERGRGRVSLSNMASLLGFPGKLGFDGSQVWDAWQGGDLAGIRAYCETDVLNTWLIWLRFAQLRGALSREQHAEELTRVKAWLTAAQGAHFAQFLSVWEACA